ncbi:MAG: hypothetical protein UE630_03630, partial [Oscillospiraceae bacterium]|nr:hypothetical protein [Oscillospiraceae bacterium]
MTPDGTRGSIFVITVGWSGYPVLPAAACAATAFLYVEGSGMHPHSVVFLHSCNGNYFERRDNMKDLKHLIFFENLLQ